MSKILKLLSITVMSSPLIMISCGQNIEPKIATISIDQQALVRNFGIEDGDNALIKRDKIKLFFESFNKDYKKYIVPPTNTLIEVPSIIPFITANSDVFSDFKITYNKPFETAPSFQILTFSFDLKPGYKSNISYGEEQYIDAPSVGGSTFSMMYRVEIPIEQNRVKEIEWIKGFFKKDTRLKVKKNSLKQEASLLIKEINEAVDNRKTFETHFEFSPSFPNELMSGWNYTVKAEIDPDNIKGIILNFTLTNGLLSIAEEKVGPISFSGFVK